mmetsp:Transcript_26708/g.48498  ORF Transcript_26708/g.48498 Transcript_26708/m.48498 type:complete len:88 (-) Transcript_26708:141-404(-)
MKSETYEPPSSALSLVATYSPQHVPFQETKIMCSVDSAKREMKWNRYLKQILEKWIDRYSRGFTLEPLNPPKNMMSNDFPGQPKKRS